MPTTRRPRNRNPMRFVTDYGPEKAEGLKRSRAVRSILSEALQRKNVERMANSPHNFVVAIQEDKATKPPTFADAVTLVVTPGAVAEIEKEALDNAQHALQKLQSRESIYTAFTYLHRFGDMMADAIGSTQANLAYMTRPETRPKKTRYAMFYNMLDDYLALLEKVEPNRTDALITLVENIRYTVNSKMGREGYSSDWGQSFADLFALCELTPPTRPLLHPFTGGEEYEDIRIYNDLIVPDFNVRFRAFYNDLVPRLYGEAVWI